MSLMPKSAPTATILAYDSCDTCRRARRFLEGRGVALTVRPIVTEPPTEAELAFWVPQSGLPLRKWLNTSGQSYRGLGKDAIAAADDATLRRWLAADGKLVKRPVLLLSSKVLVGFDEDAYAAALSAP